MKNRWGLGIVILVLICLSSTAAVAEVKVIANKSVSETEITKNKIQQIFLGKIVKWPDSSRIHFVTLEGEIHNNFLKEFIRRSPSQYKTYWKRMLFTGKGRSPKSVKTEQEMLQYIAETEGAIGYVGKSTAAKNVNAISVN